MPGAVLRAARRLTGRPTPAEVVELLLAQIEDGRAALGEDQLFAPALLWSEVPSVALVTGSPSTSSSSSQTLAGVSVSWGPVTANVYSRNHSSQVTLNRRSDAKTEDVPLTV